MIKLLHTNIPKEKSRGIANEFIQTKKKEFLLFLCKKPNLINEILFDVVKKPCNMKINFTEF